jgi:fibronectin type 3 domain-containing protein
MHPFRALVTALLTLAVFAPAASAQSGGLVAAYGFEEASGTAAVDSSSAGNAGTLSGPTRSASGRFGAALSFDGTNDLVTVADSASLDLSSAMTLEAWLRPSSGGWRTAILKERPGGLVYGLYGSTDNNRPSTEIQLGSATEVRGTSALPLNLWTHLAATYDGATMRLYVNGSQVATRNASGALQLSSGALRIGGNTVWGGEYFRGLIDEVRVYNRALTAGEIQTDMNAAVVSAGGDTEAPTAPALTGSLTGNDVHLAWSGATDNVGITGYRIFRDGALLTTLAGSAASFDDLDRPYGTYRYTVRAIDAAGNAGALSNEAAVTYADPDAGSPTAPVLTASLLDGDDVRLSWTESTDDLAVKEYRLYRDGILIRTSAAAAARTHDDLEVLPGTARYTVRAVDNADHVSPASNEESVTIVDGDGPAAPVLTATLEGGNDVHLSWTESADASGIREYRLFRNGTLLQTLDAATLTFDDVDVPLGTRRYTVRAVDNPGNVGPYSNEVAVTAVDPDAGSPTAPVLTASLSGGDDVHLSWTASSDDLGVTSYRLYRNGSLHRTLSASTLSFDIADEAVGTFTYKVVALDAAGHTSPDSNTESVTVTPDTTPPTAPVLSATVESDGVHLSWTQSTDDRAGVSSYEVYRLGAIFGDRSTRLTTVGAGTHAYVDGTSLPTNTTYRYRVLVRDAAGNFVNSSPLDVRIGAPDLEPPTAPVLTRTNGVLSWTAATDDHAIMEYAIYVDGLVRQFHSPNTLQDSGISLTPGTHQLQVKATDTAFKQSESNVLEVTVAPPPTTHAPSISAGTLALDNNDIRVTWGEAVGNAPISEYRVYRDGNLVHTAGASDVRRYWDVNMAPGTYRYRVVAVDTAGGTLTSGEAVATIAPDTSAPTAALTSACGTVQGTLDVTGTIGDDRGPLAWRLELDGQTIAGPVDVTEPTASVQRAWDTTGVADGSHQLRLVVRDGGGNETASAVCAVNVQNVVLPTGLVAAYGFEQTSGTSVTDSSGKSSTGTLSGATWATGGRFGRALSFDGVNDVVTVPDSNALDLSPGMTLEAWVKPTTVNDWRTVLLKERPGQLVYALYATGDNGRPLTEVAAGSQRDARGTAALPVGVWTHLAATYDASTLRLYVNGTQVASTAISGALQNSAGALKIGGNAIWGEYFSGLIDEVRVYERALSAAEIVADRDRAVVPGT